jgi:hypothetical protein
MSINLKPSLITKVRIQVLHEVTKELIESFGVSSPVQVFETLKKGLLDRQYFKRITVYFLNEKGNKVGEATIDIDWDKHFFIATTKDLFTLDPTKSINSNLSDALPVLIEHVKVMKKNLDVKKVTVWYWWRDDIVNENQKHKEAYAYCGFSPNPTKSPQWENDNASKVALTFTPKELQELALTITHEK